jgi:DNA modification methylase
MKNSPQLQILGKAEGLSSGIAKKSRARREKDREQLEHEIKRSPARNDIRPNLRLEYRDPSTLKEASRQVRRHNNKQLEDLKDSIGEFGLCGAPLITDEGFVIDGHALVETCISQGLSQIPCMVVDHLSKADVRRIRIALNRIQEKGEWDIEALTLELRELELEFGPNLIIPGVELAELDALLLDDQPQSGEIEKLSDLTEDSISQPGDVWKLGRHLLVHADARDHALQLSLLGNRRARLNISDAPYNVPIRGHVTSGKHSEFVMASGELTDAQFSEFLLASLDVIKQTSEDGGLVMLFMDWRGLLTLLDAGKRVGFTLLNIVTWVKTNAGMGSLYRSQHEFVVLFKKGSAPHVNNVELGKHGRYRSNVWQHPGASSLGSEARRGTYEHPTPKPTRLLEDAILDVSNRGELVIDNFVGSGSTLVAAERTGRDFFGTELDGRYVDLTMKRWSKLSGEHPVLRTTGESFEETRLRRERERQSEDFAR